MDSKKRKEPETDANDDQSSVDAGADPDWKDRLPSSVREMNIAALSCATYDQTFPGIHIVATNLAKRLEAKIFERALNEIEYQAAITECIEALRTDLAGLETGLETGPSMLLPEKGQSSGTHVVPPVGSILISGQQSARPSMLLPEEGQSSGTHAVPPVTERQHTSGPSMLLPEAGQSSGTHLVPLVTERQPTSELYNSIDELSKQLKSLLNEQSKPVEADIHGKKIVEIRASFEELMKNISSCQQGVTVHGESSSASMEWTSEIKQSDNTEKLPPVPSDQQPLPELRSDGTTNFVMHPQQQQQQQLGLDKDETDTKDLFGNVPPSYSKKPRLG